jgi:hypothetical protein
MASVPLAGLTLVRFSFHLIDRQNESCLAADV